MRHINVKWRYIAAVCVTAASLAACNNDGGGSTTPPSSAPSTVQFSTFAKSSFAANANSTPVSLDGVLFTFDADEDPTAFDMLIMSGAY